MKLIIFISFLGFCHHSNSSIDAQLMKSINKIFWFIQSGHEEFHWRQNRTIIYQIGGIDDKQVTDIHISKYAGHARAPDLKKFCMTHLTAIKPDFVIASGDLTDAKLPDKQRSKQFIEEWELYQKTVNDCKSFYDTTWLDIRGNHDAFDVPDYYDKKNLFRRYSSQGWRYPSSYSYTHVKPYGNYSIIAMDATPIPGPRRPFNFMGIISKEKRDLLENIARDTQTSNMSIWVGHYTSSLILDVAENDIRGLMRNAFYYLCGHLHTLGNYLTRMYARHGTGTIELELGDWRDNRLYRVLAIDDDMLSFTDTKLNEWPVVIITNPKDAQFISSKEPTHRIINSSDIRILVFSPTKIETVEVHIDQKLAGFADHVEGPIYTLKWNPRQYSKGLHTITVDVQISDYMKKRIEQQFSLDGSLLSFPYLPQFILRSDIINMSWFCFWLLNLAIIGPLLLLHRIQNIQTIFIKGNNTVLRFLSHFINVWLLRIWLVTKIRSLYFIFIGFSIYIGIGPWFIGDVLEDDIGISFIWGLYVKGKLIPGCLTYIYGIIQLLFFNIPMLLMTGYLIHYTRETTQKHNIPLCHKLRHIYIPFVTLVAINTFIAVTEFPMAYGTKAMVLGPVRTGSIILAFVIFHLAQKNALSVPAIHTNNR